MQSDKEGAPPKKICAAPGGGLIQTEQDFLEELYRPNRENEKKLYAISRQAKLSSIDVRFIKEWVLNQGVNWVICDKADIDVCIGAKAFRNPVVRKIINHAASQGLCLATSALKEEIEDHFSQRMRTLHLPDATRDNAADKLAKLKGFYPDSKKEATQIGVRIELVNTGVPQVSMCDEALEATAVEADVLS